MRKGFTLLLIIMLGIGLCACDASADKPVKEEESVQNDEPEYYGMWKLIRLEDLTGEYDDGFMEQVLQEMREQDADFILYIGDDSSIYNGSVSEALIFDFEDLIVIDESGQSSSFTYEAGLIAFDISDKYHCIFEKSE